MEMIVHQYKAMNARIVNVCSVSEMPAKYIPNLLKFHFEPLLVYASCGNMIRMLICKNSLGSSHKFTCCELKACLTNNVQRTLGNKSEYNAVALPQWEPHHLLLSSQRLRIEDNYLSVRVRKIGWNDHYNSFLVYFCGPTVAQRGESPLFLT